MATKRQLKILLKKNKVRDCRVNLNRLQIQGLCQAIGVKFEYATIFSDFYSNNFAPSPGLLYFDCKELMNNLE